MHVCELAAAKVQGVGGTLLLDPAAPLRLVGSELPCAVSVLSVPPLCRAGWSPGASAGIAAGDGRPVG